MAIQKWEYRLVTFNFGSSDPVVGTPGRNVLEFLNELGGEGWELVSTVPSGSYTFTLYFKRPTG